MTIYALLTSDDTDNTTAAVKGRTAAIKSDGGRP